jgi:OmpA-OmpF porin, OOP family
VPARGSGDLIMPRSGRRTAVRQRTDVALAQAYKADVGAASSTPAHAESRNHRKLDMNSTHALRLIALAGLGPLLAAPAIAQEGGYFYGGLSAGQSRSKVDENRLAESVLGAGTTATIIERDERDTAYRLFGGYQLNRYIGFEAGFFDLGKASFRATTTPAGTLDGAMRIRGVNLDVVGTLPITQNFAAIGRIGSAYSRTQDSFAGSGAAAGVLTNSTDRQANIKFGAGLQYAFSPSLMMRVEGERYRVSDGRGDHARVNTYSVGLVMPFGRGSSAAPRMVSQAPRYEVPAPQPMVVQAAPAPLPPPVAVVAAPPAPPPVVVPERRRVTYSAESMFGFDRSEVQAEGKTALDGFARELEGARYESISVTGHTDRLGSSAYNQTLSQQRADAVKSYLVTSDRVDAAKISATGSGESDPVTKAEDCKGTKAGTALIACLQPDRRVEIEVTGSR